jgi:hypothetical protein
MAKTPKERKIACLNRRELGGLCAVICLPEIIAQPLQKLPTPEKRTEQLKEYWTTKFEEQVEEQENLLQTVESIMADGRMPDSCGGYSYVPVCLRSKEAARLISRWKRGEYF